MGVLLLKYFSFLTWHGYSDIVRQNWKAQAVKGAQVFILFMTSGILLP